MRVMTAAPFRAAPTRPVQLLPFDTVRPERTKFNGWILDLIDKQEPDRWTK